MKTPKPPIRISEKIPRTIQLRQRGEKSLMALSNASVVASVDCGKSSGACGNASASSEASSQPVSRPPPSPPSPPRVERRTLRWRSSDEDEGGGNGGCSDVGDVGDKDDALLVLSAMVFFFLSLSVSLVVVDAMYVFFSVVRSVLYFEIGLGFLALDVTPVAVIHDCDSYCKHDIASFFKGVLLVVDEGESVMLGRCLEYLVTPVIILRNAEKRQFGSAF